MGTNGAEQMLPADYPYNTITFDGAAASAATTNFSLTVGTPIVAPSVDANGTVVGGWEVSVAATNLPPEMGGSADVEGLKKTATFYRPGEEIDTLGVYGNATLKKLLLIHDDPEAANVEKVYDALPTNVNVTVTNYVPGLKKRYTTNPEDPNSWKDSLEFTDVKRVGGAVSSNKVWYVLEAPGYISKTNFAWVAITPRSAWVTAKSAAKTYDGEPLTCDGLEETGGFVTGVAGHADEGVASATVVGLITDAGSASNRITAIEYTATTLLGNYSIVTNDGVLAVRPIHGATVYAVGNQKTTRFTGAEQSVTGLASVVMKTNGVEIAGNAFAADRVKCAKNPPVAKGTAVGTYNMGLVTNDFSIVDAYAKNYYDVKFVVTDGWLKITPKDLGDPSIEARPPADVVYTGKAQEPTDVVVTDKESGATLVEGTDYEIVRYENNTNVTSAAKVFLEGRGNYAGGTNLVFAITPATITVTPKSHSIDYGDPEPTYTFTLDGFVAGEDVGVMETLPVFDSAYVPRSVPGTYPITNVVAAQARNYDFVYDPASVTVNPATIVCDAPNHKKTYDGTNEFVVVTPVVPAEGAKVEYSFDGVAWTTNTPFYLDATNDVKVQYRVTAENYDMATSYVEVVIEPRPLQLSTSDATKVYDGSPLLSTNVFADSFAVGESLRFYDFNEQTVVVGVYPEAATFKFEENGTAKLSNYKVSTKFGDLTVEPSDAQIQIVSASESWTYDPAKVPFSKHEWSVVNSNLFVNGDYPIVTFSPDAQLSAVGTAANKFSFIVTNDQRGDVSAQYAGVTTRFGKLEVTRADLDAATTNFVGYYDGAAHGPGVTPSVAGATVTWLTTNLFVDVTNATARFVVSNGANYNVKTDTVEVTIRPIPVAFESASTNKVYDMKPLTFGADQITTTFGGGVAGYPAGEGFTFSGFNSITEVGRAPASFAWTNNAATKAANYDVTATFGELVVVTNNPNVVTLFAASDSFTFDGAAHSNCSFTAKNLTDGCRIVNVQFSPTSEITYPGEVANVILKAGIVNGAGEDASRLYKLVYEPGTLKMRPCEMPAPSVDAVVTVYDGRRHSITVTPAASLLSTPTVTYSESGAAESFVTNNPSYVDVNREGFKTYPVHFKVTALGYEDFVGESSVTITQRVVAVKSEGASRAYDATPLTRSAAALVDGTTLADGDGIVYQFPNSQTDVGKVRNDVSCSVTNAAGRDVTANYSIVRSADWLEITQFALKVGYAANDKLYDGETNATFKAATRDLDCPGGESVTFVADGMNFWFETPEVANGKAVHAVGYDAARNLAFADGAKRSNYAVTFDPDATAAILLAGPPALDPEPEGEEFVPGVGPFFDDDPPTTPPPAPPEDPTGALRLSNYDVVTCYDGAGHTFDTNLLHEAIRTNDWIYGEYDVYYSADAQAWTNDLAAFTYTNVVATSFWYRVVAPSAHPNYSNYYHAVGVTVTQRVVTVTALDASKVYGDADPALACTTNNLVAASDMVAGSLTRAPGEDWTPAGTFYAISENEKFDAGANYKIVFVPGEFTISRKPADDGDVALDQPGEVFYDGSAHAPTPTAYDLRGGKNPIDPREYAYSYSNNVDAGTATVTLTFTNNYANSVSTNFTVKPRSVTLTSASGEWDYDGLPHGTNEVKETAFDGAAGHGFVGGEGATYTVTGSVTNVADTATENNAFGYELNSNTKPGNYTVSRIFGDLGIRPQKLDDGGRITATSPAPRVYDGTAQEPTDVVVYDGKTSATLVEGTNYVITGWSDNVNATNSALVHLKGIGNYTNELAVAFAITQRVVTVTADDKSVTFGEDAPKYTSTMTGFVNGESAETVVSGGVSYDCKYVKGVTAANTTLPIAVDVSKLGARNYSFAGVDGALSVKPAAIAYEARKVQEIYDGAEHKVLVTVLNPAEGAKVEFSLDGGANWTTNAPSYKDATNDVTVSFRIVASNYVSEAGEVTVAIDRRPILLSTADKVKTYDGEPLQSTNVLAESYAPGESFVYSKFAGRTFPGESAASFAFADGTAKRSNYEVTTQFGTLKILPSENQIQFSSESKEWTFTPGVAEYVWPKYDAANTNLLRKGDVFAVTFRDEAKLTGVGVASNAFDVVVRDAGGADVTALYRDAKILVDNAYGKLTVKPARFRDVKTTDYEGYYDAAAHGAKIETSVANVTTNYLTQSEFTDVTNATVRFELTAPNYRAYTGEVDVVVKPIPVTFKSADKSMPCDGTSVLSVTAADVTQSFDVAEITSYPNGEGLAAGEPFASRGEVGRSDATFGVAAANESTKLSNYSVSRIYGTLLVYEPSNLVVQAASAHYVFSGATHSNAEWEALNPNVLESGHYVTNVTFSADSVIKYPGEVENRIEKFSVFDAAGNDVSAKYKCVAEHGKLTMTAKTLPKEDSAAVKSVVTAYDGTGHSIAVTPCAEIAGAATVTYSETGADGSFVADNPAYTNYNESAYRVYYKVSAPGYTDVVGYGTVTITQRVIRLSSKGASKTYDATPLTNNVADVSAATPLAAGDSAYFTFPNSQTDVGKTANLFECSVSNAANVDVTCEYDFTDAKTAGWLEVTRRAVEVTFSANDKVYDGNTNATYSGFSRGPLVGDEELSLNTNGMHFAFGTPAVGEHKTVTAYGFDAESNLTFSAGAKRGNYDVTFVPTTTAKIVKAGPPDVDPSPSDPFPPEAGPFTDEDFPPHNPPAATNAEGEVRSLSNYDYVMPYDGFGHTFLTNELFAAIEGGSWAGASIARGEYGVEYSYDGATWTNDLAAFTFTNVVATSFWYWVKTPSVDPNFSNYVHAVGIAITARVSTVTFDAADKTYDGLTNATCVATNFSNRVVNAQGIEESFTLDVPQMKFYFDTPDVGDGKKVTAYGFSDSLVAPGAGTRKENYTFSFVDVTTASIGKQRIDGFEFDAATTNCFYVGAAQTPTPVVKDGEGRTLTDADYDVAYFDNVNATDRAYAEVTLTNSNYSGVLTNFFAIRPRGVVVATEGTNFVYLAKPQSNAVSTVTAWREIANSADPADHVGFVSGEGVATNGWTEITDVPDAAVSNVLSYALRANTLAGNYVISNDWGLLTMNPGHIDTPPPGPPPGTFVPSKPPTLDVFAATLETVYTGMGTNVTAQVYWDGQPLEGFEIGYSTNEFGPFSPDFAFTNVVYADGAVTSQKVWFAVAATRNYRPATNWSWVTITPFEVKVTSEDGGPWQTGSGVQSNATWSVEPTELPPPLAASQIVCHDFATVSTDAPVTNDNTFAWRWDVAPADAAVTGNYSVVAAYGKLRVIERLDAMLAAMLSWFYDSNTGTYFARLGVACTNGLADRIDADSVSFVVTDRMRADRTMLDVALWNSYATPRIGPDWGASPNVRVVGGQTNRFYSITNAIPEIDAGEKIAQICGPSDEEMSKWYTLTHILKSLRTSTPELMYRPRSQSTTNDFGVGGIHTYVVWKTNAREYWLPVVPWEITDGKQTVRTAVYGQTYEVRDGPVSAATMNLSMALGLPLADDSEPSCELTEFSVGDGRISGEIRTSSANAEGVPQATATVTLLGAENLDDGFDEIGTLATDAQGRFEAEVDGKYKFFKVSVGVGRELFK